MKSLSCYFHTQSLSSTQQKTRPLLSLSLSKIDHVARSNWWIRSSPFQIHTKTASKTIVLDLETIDESLIATVPLPLDSTKFILHILIAFFPLGFIHSKLPRGIVLDVYNLVCGVLLAQFLFAEAWINVGVAALLTQMLVLVLPRSKVGPIVFVLIMAVRIVYSEFALTSTLT